MVNRLNKACKFFPCHRGLEDCTFCYCPFYPCRNEKLGRFVYSNKLRKNIWSCESCGWIHKTKVTESIFTLIRKNKYRIKGEMSSSKFKDQNLRNGGIGIIILSHGSKLKNANASLRKTVEAIKRKTGLNIIVPAYLQFCRPSLEKSIKKLIIMKRQTIVIVPFFLFYGNHVTRDIPRIIKKEKDKYPKVNFIYTKNLGDDTRIADIVSRQIEEAIA